VLSAPGADTQAGVGGGCHHGRSEYRGRKPRLERQENDMSGQYPPGPPGPDQPPAGAQPPYGGQSPYGGQPPDGGQPPAEVGRGGFPQYPSGGGTPAPSAKGFFGALFDFSFEHFITPIIVKVVYVVALIVLVLGWLIWTVAALSQSAGLGLLVLVFGAVVVILYLAFIRMTLEFYLAIVRMSQDIHRQFPS